MLISKTIQEWQAGNCDSYAFVPVTVILWYPEGTLCVMVISTGCAKHSLHEQSSNLQQHRSAKRDTTCSRNISSSTLPVCEVTARADTRTAVARTCSKTSFVQPFPPRVSIPWACIKSTNYEHTERNYANQKNRTQLDTVSYATTLRKKSEHQTVYPGKRNNKTDITASIG